MENEHFSFFLCDLFSFLIRYIEFFALKLSYVTALYTFVITSGTNSAEEMVNI